MMDVACFAGEFFDISHVSWSEPSYGAPFKPKYLKQLRLAFLLERSGKGMGKNFWLRWPMLNVCVAL